jgi:FtsP/CotA-like multicopper oxidase with cupredoxin domain
VGSQVDGGLYGAFIVEDPSDPVVDRELVVVFDAWAEHSEADDDHHALTDPSATLWTVNGLVDPIFPAAAGERIRVRMINASNQSYLALKWPEIRLIGGDQGLYGAPEAPTQIVLAPGDRAEAEWTPSESFDVDTAMWVASGGEALGEDRRLFTVEVEPGAAATPTEWPAGDTAPSPDPAYTDLTYTFQGGGEGAWLINGEAWPDVTVHTLPLDADTIVEVRNLSATNHPFHLHGQRFEVLSVDDVPLAARRIEDTVDVGIRQRVRLRVHADNPGEWLLHCHLLGHEEGGMMTRVRVE